MRLLALLFNALAAAYWSHYAATSENPHLAVVGAAGLFFHATFFFLLATNPK